MNPKPMLTPASLRSAPHPSPNRFPIPPKCAGNPSRKPCNRAKLAISLKLADCAGERLRDEAAKRKTASGVRDQENGTQTGAEGLQLQCHARVADNGGEKRWQGNLKRQILQPGYGTLHVSPSACWKMQRSGFLARASGD